MWLPFLIMYPTQENMKVSLEFVHISLAPMHVS